MPRSFQVFKVEFSLVREIHSEQATLKSLAEILPVSSGALHVHTCPYGLLNVLLALQFVVVPMEMRLRNSP